MSGIVITLIICTTFIVLYWLQCKYGGPKR
mgnify:CR=1 FL=1